MKEQIEEMTRDICGICFQHKYCDPIVPCENAKREAEALYNAGWRKQSEWISVEDRLPESSDIECLLLLDYNQIVIGWYHVSAGVFVEGGIAIFNKVTHWMPLPEPPKMKGGVE